MDPVNYIARFSDKFGDEVTSTTNEGKTLKMVVRGVEFVGEDFYMKPSKNDDERLRTYPKISKA